MEGVLGRRGPSARTMARAPSKSRPVTPPYATGRPWVGRRRRRRRRTAAAVGGGESPFSGAMGRLPPECWVPPNGCLTAECRVSCPFGHDCLAPGCWEPWSGSSATGNRVPHLRSTGSGLSRLSSHSISLSCPAGHAWVLRLLLVLGGAMHCLGCVVVVSLGHCVRGDA